MSPHMPMDIAPDTNRERCGNCQSKELEHLVRACAICLRAHLFCPDIFDGGEYDMHAPENHWRVDTKEVPR